MATRRSGRRATGDDGTAMVEFAFVGLIFVLFLTGIISFGLILSFKQNMTQAAAEGARAGAVAPAGTSVVKATTATEQSVDSFSKSCQDMPNNDGLTCVPTLHDCGFDPAIGSVDPAVPDCMTVVLTYDYDANPLIPKFPILAALYPKQISSSSTAEVNQ